MTFVDLLGFLAFYSSQVFFSYEKMAIFWRSNSDQNKVWNNDGNGDCYDDCNCSCDSLVVIVLESLFFKEKFS